MTVQLATERNVTVRSSSVHAAGLFMTVFAARLIYVSLFAVETPFWDQWDGEAFFLLKPWQEGTWSLLQLFSPHNEHRIAFTRILSLLVFELNAGQWNNLVLCYVNAALAAGYLTLLYLLLARDARPTARIAALVTTVLAGALPFSWENFLVGFQSQFYFMALFAILAIALATFRKTSYGNTVLVTAIACAALFTSAGGLIGAIGVMVVTTIRAWQRQEVTRVDVLTIALMGLVVGAGLYLTPELVYHESLKAQGFRDHVTALLTALMWPVEPRVGSHFRLPFRVIAAIALWIPSFLCAWQLIRNRRINPSLLFALGVSVWAGTQAVAMAHSRGHGMTVLPSRYTDIPAIALVLNAWMSFEMAALSSRESNGTQLPVFPYIIATVFTVVAVYGLVTRWPADVMRLDERTYYTGRETANVAAYIQTGDISSLDRPLFEIPYPDPKRLQMMLDDRTISAMLPPALRRPGDIIPAAPLTNAAEYIQASVRAGAAYVAPGLRRFEPDVEPRRLDATKATAPRQ